MKKLGIINKVIFLLNSIAAILLLFSYLLQFIPPKTIAILSVLSLGVPFFMLINVIFFLYWLIKMKKQFMLSLVILLIGYLFFGSLYKFSSSEKTNAENSISVMNYNVRLFNLYNWIEEDDIELKIIDLIKSESPDILSLQEYHPHKNINLSFFKYKYEKLSGNKAKYGQAIFSKFPIVNSGSIDFKSTSNNAIFADIVKGSDTIRVYNIHLESMRIDAENQNFNEQESELLLKRVIKTFKIQQSQTELFLEHKKLCKYKVIVSGDFNNTEFSYAYKQVKGDLTDAFKKAGSGFGKTYALKFFPVRIDFILTDKDIEVNSFKTFDEKYSDHYPIKATLKLH